MIVYKVSIVVEVGKTIQINGNIFTITEIIELTPPRGNFRYLHLTCQPQKP